MKNRWWLKFKVAPILNIFGSIRSPRRVDNFPSKDHYINLTLTHSNLSLNIKPTLIQKHGERERRDKDQINKSENWGSFGQEERERKKIKDALGP